MQPAERILTILPRNHFVLLDDDTLEFEPVREWTALGL